MKRKTQSESLFRNLEAGFQELKEFIAGKRSLYVTLMGKAPDSYNGREVLRLRKRMKISQVDFADLLNVSPKTLQSWERGDRKPSKASVRRLQALRMPGAARRTPSD